IDAQSFRTLPLRFSRTPKAHGSALSFRPAGEILLRSLVSARDDGPCLSLGELCAFARDYPNPVFRILLHEVRKGGDLFPLSKLLFIHSNDAAKTKMARGSIDGLGHACCRSIAPAVIGRAQMRSALHDFAWDLDVRHVGIVAFVLVAAFGVEASAT